MLSGSRCQTARHVVLNLDYDFEGSSFGGKAHAYQKKPSRFHCADHVLWTNVICGLVHATLLITLLLYYTGQLTTGRCQN